MSIKELREQIDIMQSQYVDTRKLETELYQRFTIPLASLMFALIGAPLGIQPNRSSSSIGFGISIIIIFIYYTLMTLAGAIGQGFVHSTGNRRMDTEYRDIDCRLLFNT